MSLADRTITIFHRYRGGWSFEAWFEPELFAPEITARGRGRNEREAIGDLLYQAKQELNLKIGTAGRRTIRKSATTPSCKIARDA